MSSPHGCATHDVASPSTPPSTREKRSRCCATPSSPKPLQCVVPSLLKEVVRRSRGREWRNGERRLGSEAVGGGQRSGGLRTRKLRGVGEICFRVCNPTAVVHLKRIQRLRKIRLHRAGPKTMPCPGQHYGSVRQHRQRHEAYHVASGLGHAFSDRVRAGLAGLVRWANYVTLAVSLN